MSFQFPLERLLSSRARAALVRWAVESGTPTPLGDLARQLGFTPAGLRREVPGLVDLGVLRVVRHGNTDVLKAGPNRRLHEALASLVDALDDQPRQRARAADRLRAELAALGAPLAVEPAKRPRAAETVLVDALGLAREDATVLRTLPVVLQQLGSRLDWTRLRHEAQSAGRSAELGMLASLTADLAGRPELKREVDDSEDHRRTRVRFFHSGHHSWRELELAERRTPRLYAGGGS